MPRPMLPPTQPDPSLRSRTLATLLLAGLGMVCLLALGGCGSDEPSGPVVDPVDFTPLPGGLFLDSVYSVRDARFGDDHIWLMDTRRYAIHRFDNNFENRLTFGSRGQGPGEFLMPQSLVLVDDGIMVVDFGRVPRLKHFSVEGELLGEEDVPFEGCDRFTLHHAREIPGGIGLIGQCMFPSLLSETGILPHFVTGVFEYEPGSGTPARPVLRSSHGIRETLSADHGILGTVGTHGAWVGVTADPCLQHHPRTESDGADSDWTDPICLDMLPRIPIPDDMREEFDALRARGGIARFISIPDHQPPVDHLFSVDAGLVLRGISGEHARRLFLVRPDGTREVLEDAAPLWSFADDNRLLLTWQVAEGTMVLQRPIP